VSRDKSPNGSGRITSYDVADKAGVSQSTVSRVFSGDERLSGATRKKVLAVAQKLGYKPNTIARSLTTQQTQIIGLVAGGTAGGMDNPYFPSVLQAFTRHLHRLGWKVLMITAGSDDEVDELLSEILLYQVDGLIIVSAALNQRITQEAVGHGIPVLLFSHHAPGLGVSAVTCDNVKAGQEVADAFLDAGCKRLVYIGGKDTSIALERRQGFVNRLAQRKVVGCQVVSNVFTYKETYQASLEMLKAPEPPDAIFCSHDVTAFGVLDAARELGVKVPEQLSVIGFDDIPMAEWAAYNLTTVRQPTEAMIDAAIELLLERIKDSSAEAVTKFLPGTLVRRRSTRW
jgi:DNA-binding LacI/PurR family transcriptional regulator